MRAQAEAGGGDGETQPRPTPPVPVDRARADRLDRAWEPSVVRTPLASDKPPPTPCGLPGSGMHFAYTG
ncbi:hypothetical protein GCM10018952_17420 [Streptosporangium vulgare]